MTQSADKGLNHAMQKAADTRVFTNAINAKKNKHKLGNPRVFIKKFLAICRTATTSNDTEKLSDEVHAFVHSDLALFKLHQTAVGLQRASADANVGTLKQKQDELQGQIKQVEEEIEAKKVELQESKVYKQNQEEYEQIKRMITTFPKKSESRAAIAKVAADIAALEQESQRLDNSVALRKKQFCQLGLLLREIGSDIDAPGVVPDDEEAKEEEGMVAVQDTPASDTLPQPMQE